MRWPGSAACVPGKQCTLRYTLHFLPPLLPTSVLPCPGCMRHSKEGQRGSHVVEGRRAVAAVVPQRASGIREVTDTLLPSGAVAVKIQLV